MPIKDKDKMLQKSDCTMPPPKDYPGKYNRNNSNGSLLTRSEWIKKEAEKCNIFSISCLLVALIHSNFILSC